MKRRIESNRGVCLEKRGKWIETGEIVSNEIYFFYSAEYPIVVCWFICHLESWFLIEFCRCIIWTSVIEIFIENSSRFSLIKSRVKSEGNQERHEKNHYIIFVFYPMRSVTCFSTSSCSWSKFCLEDLSAFMSSDFVISCVIWT